MARLYPIVLVAMLGGCLALPKLTHAPDAELISVETDAGFCMGDCNRFDIRISSNGRGLLRLHHNDEVSRFQAFRLTPGAYRAFRDAIAPYRPVGDKLYQEPAVCDQFATDLGGYHLSWLGGGAPGRLAVNDGCFSKGADAARSAIRAAVATLKLKNLPDPSQGVAASTLMPGKR
jgi:hypothetical protein